MPKPLKTKNLPQKKAPLHPEEPYIPLKFIKKAIEAGYGEYPNQQEIKDIANTRDPSTLSPGEIKIIDWAYQEEIIKQLRYLRTEQQISHHNTDNKLNEIKDLLSIKGQLKKLKK